MTVMSAIKRVADSIWLHFGLFGARSVLMRALVGVCGLEFKAPIPQSSRKILLIPNP
jgi:hypothetical protein